MDITLTDLHNQITEFQRVVTTRLDTIDRRLSIIDQDIATVRHDLSQLFPAIHNDITKIDQVRNEIAKRDLEEARTTAQLRQDILELKVDITDISRDLTILVKTEMTNVGNTLSSRLDRAEAHNQQQLAVAAAAVFDPSIKTFEEFRDNAEEQVKLWLNT